MRWDLDHVATVCGGVARGRATVDSVSIDSRTVVPGGLFVAVKGERHDGHDFIASAVAAGAAAVVAGTGRLGSAAGVEVSNTLEALRALAIARRDEIRCPVIAVTGSSGKTTTKDLTAAALGTGTHASPHSYNNEYGVPLTLLGTPDDATGLVVEMGSRGPGHIAHLGPAVRPDAAVITNVGRAHLETFGSVAGVIEAKWELIEALGEGGTAVLPAWDHRLLDRAVGRVVTFGEEAGGDVDAVGVEMDETGHASFELCSGDSSFSLRMPLPGRHQAVNAAAAVAAAVAIGRDFSDSALGIEVAEVSQWRMDLVSVPLPGGEIVVVNDAYNANPDSMASALDTVVAIPGRHIAVLGKMHELGDFEAESHREAGALAAGLGFVVVTVGEDPGFAEGAGSAAISVPNASAALEKLREMIAPGDVILVKGSRAAGLEAVAAGLEGGSG